MADLKKFFEVMTDSKKACETIMQKNGGDNYDFCKYKHYLQGDVTASVGDLFICKPRAGIIVADVTKETDLTKQFCFPDEADYEHYVEEANNGNAFYVNARDKYVLLTMDGFLFVVNDYDLKSVFMLEPITEEVKQWERIGGIVLTPKVRATAVYHRYGVSNMPNLVRGFSYVDDITCERNRLTKKFGQGYEEKLFDMYTKQFYTLNVKCTVSDIEAKQFKVSDDDAFGLFMTVNFNDNIHLKRYADLVVFFKYNDLHKLGFYFEEPTSDDDIKDIYYYLDCDITSLSSNILAKPLIFASDAEDYSILSLTQEYNNFIGEQNYKTSLKAVKCMSSGERYDLLQCLSDLEGCGYVVDLPSGLHNVVKQDESVTISRF